MRPFTPFQYPFLCIWRWISSTLRQEDISQIRRVDFIHQNITDHTAIIHFGAKWWWNASTLPGCSDLHFRANGGGLYPPYAKKIFPKPAGWMQSTKTQPFAPFRYPFLCKWRWISSTLHKKDISQTRRVDAIHQNTTIHTVSISVLCK